MRNLTGSRQIESAHKAGANSEIRLPVIFSSRLNLGILWQGSKRQN